MGDFNIAVQYVLGNEGGLEENQNDPAGVTNFGISLRFLKALLPEKLKQYGLPMDSSEISKVDIEQLTIDKAKDIYKGEFWDHVPFERINNQNICNFLFDAAVNMGLSPAIKCVQRALWAVNKTKGIVIDDGILGNKTIDLINSVGAFLLLPAIRSERAGEYRMIAEKNPTEKEYLDGWLSRAYGVKE